MGGEDDQIAKLLDTKYNFYGFSGDLIETVNPLMAKYSDGLYSGTEKPFYWIISSLETIHEIIPYSLRNPPK